MKEAARRRRRIGDARCLMTHGLRLTIPTNIENQQPQNYSPSGKSRSGAQFHASSTASSRVFTTK